MTNPDVLEDEIVSALRRIVRAIDLQSRRMVEECGLTGPQIVVLREAGRLSGSSISALARAVSLGQPTVSGILDRFEAQGLVRRTRSTQDRRSVYVSVTPQGARVLKKAPSLLQVGFRSELSRLDVRHGFDLGLLEENRQGDVILGLALRQVQDAHGPAGEELVHLFLHLLDEAPHRLAARPHHDRACSAWTLVSAKSLHRSRQA